MQTLQVELGERSYPIFIGEQLLSNTVLLEPYIKGKQVVIVTNETVAPLYLSKLEASLSSFSVYQCHHIILPDGEQYKNWQILQLIYDGLLKLQCSRKATLIALGGGVIGDMTGFAAATYQRGIDFIQIPTTLLSQVDSSVGGKTGINHPLGKNMIGAFYQPNAVLVDVTTLATLPARELSAGLAEVIKYGVIADVDFLDWLERHLDEIMALDYQLLMQAVEKSCALKAKIVSLDEKETGVRAILNLGHTFGHAIESHQGYGVWLHGEAVSAGMVIAAEMSYQMGWITEEMRNRVIRVLAKANLPICPPKDMTAADFLKYMKVDKKNLEGQIRLVLLKDVGHAMVTDKFSQHDLNVVLEIDYQTLTDTILAG